MPDSNENMPTTSNIDAFDFEPKEEDEITNRIR